MVRFELAKKIDQKYVPEIRFVYDNTLERADRIEELLNNLETEKNIFDIITREPSSFEKIQLQMKDRDSSDLMVTLTNLELKGLIKQVNGQYLLG